MSVLIKKLCAEITDIYISNNHVYDVVQEEIPLSFYDDLNNYYRNNFDSAVEEYSIPLTKKECLSMSSDVILRVYGIYSGRKLHQLPLSLKSEVSKMLKKTDIYLSK